jgi:5'-AMP-activated protein kinase regulatory gamma subunit
MMASSAGVLESRQLLMDTPVSTIIPEKAKNVISVTSTDSIVDAFEKMIQHQILSLPVYDQEKHSFTSFIDVLDILSLALKLFSEDELYMGHLSKLFEFRTETCGEVADLSGRDPFLPVESTSSLLTLIQHMIKHKLHRIPCVDANGNMVALVTQMDVMKFLSDNIGKLGELATSKVEKLQLGFGQVYAVTPDQRAIDAFKMIKDMRVSGVCVVDHNGIIIGNISASDLKLIGYDGKFISRLLMRVEEFLKLIPRDESIPIQGPICVRGDTTFEEVLAKILITRIHRIYIIDGASLRPSGVISPSEIMKSLLEYVQSP